MRKITYRGSSKVIIRLCEILNAVIDALGGKADVADIPTKTSDLTNDSGFITNTVNNLVNYYLKSETYTQAEVNSLIGAISTLHFEVVQVLPVSDISTNTIYLVPKQTPGTSDVYDEYIYVNNAWEHIGSTEIDLTGYVTTQDLADALADYVLTTDLQTLIADYYTAAEVDTLLANKADTSDIPTDLADLSDDTTHRLVTDTEKSTWNNKSDFSGSYNDLTDKPTIPAAQIQSDWNQSDSTALDYIKNKPTIPSVPVTSVNGQTGAVVLDADDVGALPDDTPLFSGDYDDLTNKPTIPSVSANPQSTTDTLNAIEIDGVGYAIQGGGAVTSVNGQTGAVVLDADDVGALPDSTVIPSKTSDLTNDSGFISDIDNTTPTVTEAATRANLSVGDTLKTIIGKIKKFFTDLKTVAFTGSYNDLTDKPTIPTVNNGTLTIQRNGTQVATFTANQSSNSTANISVPTTAADVGALPVAGNATNVDTPTTFTDIRVDSIPQFAAGTIDYFLGIEAFASGGRIKWQAPSDVKTALGVPTKTSQLTNDSGFVTSSGSVAAATTATRLVLSNITIKTGSSAQQKITLATLMTWLITTNGYIPSNTYCYKVIETSWNYAGNDILQLSAHGVNYELQLAGVFIEFMGHATNYNTGEFRLRIHTSPTVSFTPTSGYTQFPTSHIAEYTCNGSSYSPTWKIIADRGDVPTNVVSKAGDTITGTLILSKTTDASGVADNRPALIVGGTPSQAHIEMDGNEIVAKADATHGAALYLNWDGGGVVYTPAGGLYCGSYRVLTTADSVSWSGGTITSSGNAYSSSSAEIGWRAGFGSTAYLSLVGGRTSGKTGLLDQVADTWVLEGANNTSGYNKWLYHGKLASNRFQCGTLAFSAAGSNSVTFSGAFGGVPIVSLTVQGNSNVYVRTYSLSASAMYITVSGACTVHWMAYYNA